MKKSSSITWDIDVPLVTNSFFVYQTTILCIVTGIVMTMLLGFIFLMQGEYDALPQLILGVGILIVGLWVLMMLIMLIVFGNRMPMGFRVDEKGVAAFMKSPVGKVGNRFAFILGVLLRKPEAAGAGMLAMSQESVSFDWSSIAKVQIDQNKRQILISNSWRPLVAIYATPKNFTEVTNFIHTHNKVVNHHKNPLPSLLLRTVGIFIATVPLFLVEFPLKTDLFLIIFTISFALATIWLIPIFGYVVFVGVFLMLGSYVYQGSKMYESSYSFIGNYRGFEMISGDEWFGVILALAGLAYLSWISWRAIRGRDVPALFSD